jgi:hypothetical protein
MKNLTRYALMTIIFLCISTSASVWPESRWTPAEIEAMKVESARNMAVARGENPDHVLEEARKRAIAERWEAQWKIADEARRKAQAEVPDLHLTFSERMALSRPRYSVTCSTYSTYGRRYSSTHTSCY